jgi:PKHD-type hydroxylase
MFFFEPPNQIISWSYNTPNVLDHKDIALIEEYATANSNLLTPAGMKTQDDKSGLDRSYRSTDVMFLHDTSHFAGVYAKLVNAAVQCNAENFKYNLTYIESLQYSVYRAEDGGKYGMHLDTCARYTSGNTRKLSFTILLNDPSEFEGGELMFHTAEEPFVPPLQTGEMVLFPSFLMHSVAPVTQGVRKSLVGWLCGPNFV